jgi:acyl-CoA thioesterase
VDTFAIDSAVTALGAGRYSAQLTSRFTILRGAVNGGYGMAVCVRALAAELDHPDPLVVSASFLRPLQPGPVIIDVEPVRSGRRQSVGEARLIQDEREVIRMIATFADLGEAVTKRADVAAPALPPPEDCLDPVAGLDIPPDSLFTRTEIRTPRVPGWLTGSPSGDMTAEFWLRLAGGEPADTIALTSIVDMAPPAVFEIGEFQTTTVELTVQVRARPAPGWLACRVFSRFVIGSYVEEDFEIWDSAGTLVAQSRQLQLMLG